MNHGLLTRHNSVLFPPALHVSVLTSPLNKTHPSPLFSLSQIHYLTINKDSLISVTCRSEKLLLNLLETLLSPLESFSFPPKTNSILLWLGFCRFIQLLYPFCEAWSPRKLVLFVAIDVSCKPLAAQS